MNNQRTTRKQGVKRYRWVGTMRQPVKTRSEHKRNRSRRRREEKARLMKFRDLRYLRSGGNGNAYLMKFRDLRYLRSGENGNAYLMGNSKLLKLPRTGKLNPKEVFIHDALARLGLPYFPKLYEHGKVLTGMAYNNYKNLNKSTITSFGRGVGPYPYDFIVMEYIEGGMPIQDYIQTKYGGLFADGRVPTIEEKQDILNDFIAIFAKIGFALYVAWKVTNFQHTDLHDKNFLVKPDGTPVILDYGRSKLFTNEGRMYKMQKEGTDLGTAMWESLDSDNYTIPGLKTFIQNLKNLVFTEIGVEKASDSIGETIQKLIQLKTGLRQPFSYAASFQTLGVPDDIIARGQALIENRQAVVRTAEKNEINTINAATMYQTYGLGLPQVESALAQMKALGMPPEAYLSNAGQSIAFSSS